MSRTAPATTAPVTPLVHHVALAVAAVGWFATAALLLARPQVPLDRVQLVPTTLAVVCGTIIVLRTETRLIGWLLVIAGVLWPLIPLTFQQGPAPPPDTAWNSFLQALGEEGNTCIVLLLLVYPTGRFDSTLARVLGAVTIAPTSVMLPLELLAALGVVDAPLVIPFDLLITAFGAIILFGLGMQVGRYRRRSRVERLQIKWFLLAVATWLGYPVIFLLDLEGAPVAVVADLLITASIPVAVLVAITRYRLYEIDRIISRAVAYVLVLGVLAAVFVGSVALVTTVLPAQDQLAVAATTVAVVALFNPLRRRVVAAVDRRFDRTRYVAQQVIEQFGRAVADTTDLDDLRGRVHEVVGRTVAPRTVAVWQPADEAPAMRS